MWIKLKHRVEVTGDALDRLAGALLSLAWSARRAVDIFSHLTGFGKPPAPTGTFTLSTAKELDMGFGLKARLPQLPADAPASLDYCNGGVIKWTKNDVPQPEIVTGRNQLEVAYDATDPASPLAAFKAELGDMVGGSFDFTDRSGNLSGTPIVVAPFAVTDTQLPPAPTGDFELGVSGEVD